MVLTRSSLLLIAAEPRPGRHPTQMSLPAMSFEVKGLAYDAGRKLVPTHLLQDTSQLPVRLRTTRPVQKSQFLPVPYNLQVEMSIISKTQDDGLQILEQILPALPPFGQRFYRNYRRDQGRT